MYVVFGTYFLFLMFVAGGLWRWQKQTPSSRQRQHPLVSVVVAMRNEAQNLQPLLQSLQTQTYSGPFQILLVDDHSTDNTLYVAGLLKVHFSNLKIELLASEAAGKKQALATGIAKAGGEIILTTDADCELQADWINDMVQAFDNHTQLVVGVVKLTTNATVWSKLQAMEFASVIATGLGSLGWGMPLMCNGASLAFRKAAFYAVSGYKGNEHIPSGDDEFLMHKVANHFPRSVKAVPPGLNLGTTLPVTTVADFFDQRVRWAGKWRANQSGFARLLAVFIFLVQLSWWPLLAAALVTPHAGLSVVVVFKIMLELLLLLTVSFVTRQRFDVLAFACLQILYAPYVLAVAVASQLMGYSWKGRTTLPGE
ncbi:MAG: glycosyltransferase [Cytophagales bacterium]|nr:glycosyltransferase [Cytophagales bacterium]